MLDESDRALIASSPATFAHWTSSQRQPDGKVRRRWQPFPHLRLLNEAIMRAVSGGLAADGKTGLILSTPPRHGKSELVSRALPAWYLGRNPDSKVILGGYQATFAARWGQKARDLLTEHGPEVFGVTVASDSASRELWEIAGRDGAMRTAGVGGAITGFGADLLIIDDPIKNAQDAASDVMRENLWEWWTSTARTRLHAGGVAVVMATRWHEDDLIGRLIQQARDDPDADQWEIINLPAIAEPDDDSGEFDDPLGRKLGEPLCRALGYDEAWAKRTQASVGSYVWHALYQGKPRPADGLLFKRTDLRYYRVQAPSEQWPAGLYMLEDEGGLHPVDPRACAHFQTSDTAASEKEMADYTVVSTWAVTPVERYLLLVHVERGKFEDTRVGAMLEGEYNATHDPDGVPRQRPGFVSVENAGPSGPKVIKQLLAKGLPVRSANPDTDKVTRSLPAVALWEAHRFYVRRGAGWLRDWEHEHLGFPNATNDDQVDTTSYAAIELPRVQFASRRQKGGRGTELGGLASKQL